MNTDQQTYYTNPTPTAFYSTNGIEQQYTVRNPPMYPGPRMTAPYYNPTVQSGFSPQQYYYQPGYAPPAPFNHNNGPRNQFSIPIVRPANENPSAGQSYMSPPNYSTYPNPTLLSGQALYTAPFQYPMTNYGPLSSATQIPNPQQSSMQYSTPNNQVATQSGQTSQQSTGDQTHGSASQSQPRDNGKRERKPLAIVDPKSNKAVEVEKPVLPTPTITNDESTTDSKKSKDDTKESQIKAKFR